MSTVRQGLRRPVERPVRTFQCQWCSGDVSVNIDEMTWDCDPNDATAFLECGWCDHESEIIAKFTEGAWHFRLERWEDED